MSITLNTELVLTNGERLAFAVERRYIVSNVNECNALMDSELSITRLGSWRLSGRVRWVGKVIVSAG